MQFTVPFGKLNLQFSVPSKLDIAFTGDMRPVAPISNIKKAIHEQLDYPIGTPSLGEMARDKKNIVILIEDNTRHTPLQDILPILIEYLNGFDVHDSDISFLVALGTHRLMTQNEMVEKIGIDLYKRFRVFQHDAANYDELVDLGYVDPDGYNIPVHVNRIAVEADLLIGVGDIVPHSDAGYSGGSKIIQPGVCGFATTAATHIAAALLPEIPLGMAENPCRLGMDQVAKKVGLSFILNIVKNSEGQVIAVFGGDFIKAHREGIAIAKLAYGVKIPRLADIAVVSSYPCDLDYWQANKGLISAYFAAKPGGIIIFATPCYEGLEHNHPKLRDWLKLTFRDALAKAKTIRPEDLEEDLVAADIAMCNARIREKCKVFIVTDGLSDEDIDILGYVRFPTIQSALDEALRLSSGSDLGILPKGGISLPILSDEINGNIR